MKTLHNTKWNFQANEIEISSELSRELQYGYGNPQEYIAASVYKYVCNNNDYGYNQVEEWDTYESIMAWLPKHIYKLLRSLEVVDTKGSSYGCASDYFKPTNAQRREWAAYLSCVHLDNEVRDGVLYIPHSGDGCYTLNIDTGVRGVI